MESNHRDTLVAATIALGSGAIIGAFAFGPWHSITAFFAEAAFYGWAAAIGTLAVGFAAFWLANAAHRLRVSEVNSAGLLADQNHDALVHSLSTLVAAYQVPGMILGERPGKDQKDTRPIRDRENADTLTRRIRSAMSTVSGVDVLRVSFVLRQDDMNRLVKLQATASMFICSCDEFLERGERGLEGVSERAKRSFLDSQKSAEKLKDQSVALNTALANYLRIPPIN